MIVLFWLAILCFYFQIHQLTFQMMASQSMISLSQHDSFLFLNWVGNNSHFQNYFLFNPSLYFVLEIIKHVTKIQKKISGGRRPKSKFLFTDVEKLCIELENVQKLKI